MLPTVSILVPTRDRADLLMQVIASVQKQTRDDWQLIIADDNSSDDTRQRVLAASASDPRIQLLTQDPARPGAPARRNDATRAAKGKYFIYFDDDDLFFPACLESRIATIEADKSLDFAVFPAVDFFDVPGDAPDQLSRVQALIGYSGPDEDLDLFLAVDFPWGTASPIWKREAIAKVGPWDETLPSWQDWDFQIRAICAGLTYRKFNRPDYGYRLQGKSKRPTVGTGSKKLDQLASRKPLLAKLARLLRQSGKMNEVRRQSLTAIYFHVANQLLLGQRVADATTTWEACRDESVCSFREFIEGWIYFQTYPSKFNREFLKRYLRKQRSRYFTVSQPHPTKPEAGTARHVTPTAAPSLITDNESARAASVQNSSDAFETASASSAAVSAVGH